MTFEWQWRLRNASTKDHQEPMYHQRKWKPADQELPSEDSHGDTDMEGGGRGGEPVRVLHGRESRDFDDPVVRRWLWFGATPLRTH